MPLHLLVFDKCHGSLNVNETTTDRLGHHELVRLLLLLGKVHHLTNLYFPVFPSLKTTKCNRKSLIDVTQTFHGPNHNIIKMIIKQLLSKDHNTKSDTIIEAVDAINSSKNWKIVQCQIQKETINQSMGQNYEPC